MVSQAIKGADQPQAQWYWKSNSDPWSTNGNEEWTKYADIESAIIEEAFNQKNKIKLAELDNYSINLNECIQISKSDPNKQRQIKRVLTNRNESQDAPSRSLWDQTFPVDKKSFSPGPGPSPVKRTHFWTGMGLGVSRRPLAPSSLIQLLVTSWSSEEHWCGEAEMLSGSVEHLGYK
ncbi:unnamed protein product [Didymodactylos carnosus]|uniref:WWE domain-containing protein n=1 Tax=Didymodactylos carnosus TaxID=1234261 RepID=A0A8S2EIX3_9BILA|nr:unnamed protein product [Didymodactylos carnosus]CAF4043751.1 unnamed protein product [Didymodactylos carnosus]